MQGQELMRRRMVQVHYKIVVTTMLIDLGLGLEIVVKLLYFELIVLNNYLLEMVLTN
ncbi:hypothetical protein BACERE00187_03228 [Bacillus cereus]|nr:hypothetical protein BACERE00187_03228 [Bacillus cereus]